MPNSDKLEPNVGHLEGIRHFLTSQISHLLYSIALTSLTAAAMVA